MRLDEFLTGKAFFISAPRAVTFYCYRAMLDASHPGTKAVKTLLAFALAAASCVNGSTLVLAQAAHVSVFDNGDLLGTWDQSLTPSPDSSIFGKQSVVPIFNAKGDAAGFTDAYWFNNADYGGVALSSLSSINTTGLQSYTGLETAPVFVPGFYQEFIGQGNDYTVTISVPEPATWAMMLVGFGVIGFAARRRQSGSLIFK